MLTLAVCDNGTGTEWQIRSFTANGHTVTIEDQAGVMPIQFLNDLQANCEANSNIAADAKIIIESQTAAFTGVQECPNHTFAIHKTWFDGLNDKLDALAAIEMAITAHSWVKANTIDTTIRLAKGGQIMNQFRLRQRGDARHV
jgi:hypothetical protein